MAVRHMTSHIMQDSFRMTYNKHAGIATRYKLEGSVFVPRWEKEKFLRPALGPT